LVIRAHGHAGSASRRSGHHIGDLCVVEKLAHRGTAQISAIFGADHAHPHLPDRIGHHSIGRSFPFGEGAVEAEVHVHRRTADIVVEQMLPPRVGATQHPTVDSGGRRGKPALRTGYRHRRAGKPALVQPGQAVQSMPFWHSRLSSVLARHRRHPVSSLVLVEDADTPLVSFGFRPWRAEERIDDGERFGNGVHPAADAD
jgi:hypothetical protein